MKLMFSALLLSISLGAFAQDEDELMDAVAEEEAAEVSAPTAPSEGKFFHRVQLGFVGTFAKYTNNSTQRRSSLPASEKYFLKGLNVGWIGDLHIAKRLPLYLELGGELAWMAGSSSDYVVPNRMSNGEGIVTNYHHSVQAFTLTIPVGVTYQFKNVGGVEGLTVAPLVGIRAQLNLVAKRKEKRTVTEYKPSVGGQDVIDRVVETVENKSLMKEERKGGWMEGRPHAGRLLQFGAQIGVNAFYKHYSFGLSYVYDFMPFARHSSPLGLYSEDKSVGGIEPKSGTGCDMKIVTNHNFAVTFGYIF